MRIKNKRILQYPFNKNKRVSIIETSRRKFNEFFCLNLQSFYVCLLYVTHQQTKTEGIHDHNRILYYTNTTSATYFGISYKSM